MDPTKPQLLLLGMATGMMGIGNVNCARNMFPLMAVGGESI